jgi:hypothetical protein
MSTAIVRYASDPAWKLLAPRTIAPPRSGRTWQWAASCAALTAASLLQERGRERPHPPLGIVAPPPLDGVAHALAVIVPACTGCERAACRVATSIPVWIRVTVVDESSGQRSMHLRLRSCGRFGPPLVPLVCEVGCGVRRRSPGRPSCLSILERHALAWLAISRQPPARMSGRSRRRTARSATTAYGRARPGQGCARYARR